MLVGALQRLARPTKARGAVLCATCLSLATAGVSAQSTAGGGADVLLDSASIDCLTCHDAALDPLGVDPLGHPVGVIYGRDDALSDLRPRHLLPAAIVLPDGRVSCLSCHVVEEDGRHGSLVLDAAASALCSNCHDL